MKRSITIALTVDPEIPVPPRYYGGIERIVDMLIRGLLRRNHRVVLFARAGSTSPAELRPWPGSSSGSLVSTIANARALHHFVRSSRPDVIHSFARMAYLLPVLRSPLPKIQSYQRQITSGRIRGAERFGKSLSFTACSRSCRDSAGLSKSVWALIPNGVPLDVYRYCDRVPAGAPLVFLGRMERIKGAHTAILAAKQAGRSLVLLGNRVETPEGAAYFDTEIKPHLDGERIRYAGPVDDAAKSKWLGGAAALLFPIEWEEPFGIVMVEALACGTPVVAFSRGAVPEVVDDGVTGFICRDAAGMAKAVSRLGEISRENCRKAAEERFSDEVIVNAYEKLYYERLK